MILTPSVRKAFKLCTVEQKSPDDDKWLLKAKKMPRKDYEQFKTIVNAMRGEWVRKADAHIFGHDCTKEIEALVETGIVPSYVDNPFSFFPTPYAEVEDMVYIMARIQDRITIRVAETGAGDGRIIKEVLKACPTADVRYWEIDERSRQLLEPLNATLEGHDFLGPGFEHLNGTFDYVLMNPEFAGKTYQKHVRRAYDLLRVGGCLVSVMPAMAITDKEFRNWMFKGGESSWYLGEHEFADTNVKYMTVQMRKNEREHDANTPLGYGTWDAYIAILNLESDALFYQALEGVTSFPRLVNVIEQTVDRLVRVDVLSLCLDTETLEAVAAYFAEDLKIEIETSEKQLSLVKLMSI